MTSFQFFVDAIDQLDLAIDQLALHDRNFDRFVLMLVDNVVELALHRFAEEQQRANAFWIRIGKPKLDEKAIERAVGQRFAPKVALAETLHLVSAQEATSLRHLHRFRNVAYHQGLRQKRILHSLSAFYLRLACDILGRYRPRSQSWGSTDVLPFRAQKYIGPRANAMSTPFVEAFARLGSIATANGEGALIQDLADDLEHTIDDIDDALAFLSTDAPEPCTRDAAVLEAQTWAFAFSEAGTRFAAERGFSPGHPVERVGWLKREYRWSETGDPVPSWRDRLAVLRKLTDPHAALTAYSDFMRNSNSLRDAITESAMSLDRSIQMQIDAARGK